MFLLNLVIVLVIPIVANGFGRIYWIKHGQICNRTYSYGLNCIQSTYCLDRSYAPTVISHWEYCNLFRIHPVLCCVQDGYRSDDIASKAPTQLESKFSESNNNSYQNVKLKPQKQESDFGGSYNNPFQTVRPKPQEQNSDFGGSYNNPDENVRPKPNPPNPPIQSTLDIASAPDRSDNIPSSNPPGNSIAQLGSVDRQNVPQTLQTIFGNANAPPQSNNEVPLNITIKPLYTPTLQNSTSLQKCREWFTAFPLSKGPHTPIVGGRDARPKEFPHMALLGFGEPNDIQWSCGGTLISERFVLTAAHCLNLRPFGPVRYVRLGELDVSTTTEDSGVREYAVSDIIKHPNHRFGISYYDIALLGLNEPAPINEYIKPACLPTSYDVDKRPLVAAGWGLLEAGGVPATILQKASLRHVPHDKCKRIYGRPRNIKYGIIDELQVCADGGSERRDACQGDSGGPLMMTNYDYYDQLRTGFVEIVGITSFGIGCGKTAGVYTRVATFLEWIENNIWAN